MTKSILAVLVSALLSFNAFATEEVKDAALIAKMQKNLPIPIDAVFKSQIPGLYELSTADRQIVYTNEDGRFYLIGGQLVDFENKINFTQERKANRQVFPWEAMPLKAAFQVKRGNGSRKLAVFTDPDCPYCQRIEGDLASLSDVTIYYFMMPIDRLHPMARSKAISVWCSKDQATTWYDMMLNGKKPELNSNCDHPLDEIAKFAAAKRISATPTIINAKGMMIEGAPKRDRLEAFISAN